MWVFAAHTRPHKKKLRLCDGRTDRGRGALLIVAFTNKKTDSGDRLKLNYVMRELVWPQFASLVPRGVYTFNNIIGTLLSNCKTGLGGFFKGTKKELSQLRRSTDRSTYSHVVLVFHSHSDYLSHSPSAWPTLQILLSLIYDRQPKVRTIIFRIKNHGIRDREWWFGLVHKLSIRSAGEIKRDSSLWCDSIILVLHLRVISSIPIEIRRVNLLLVQIILTSQPISRIFSRSYSIGTKIPINEYKYK